MAKNTPETPPPPMTSETAPPRPVQLGEKMARGELPLDEMISAFEEGRKLVAFCTAKLTEVQQRVEVIKRQEADGSLLREPLDAGTAGQA